MSWTRAKAIADAVLYEGYLLYPYRASSAKNQSRWQFGVLGPPGAAAAGIGEPAGLAAQCLLEPGADAAVTLTVRFLQLQHRQVEWAGEPVGELTVGGTTWLTWDEAVEREYAFGPLRLVDLFEPRALRLQVPGGEDVEPVGDGAGRLVRTRSTLSGELELSATLDGTLVRLSVAVHNTGNACAGNDTDKDAVIAQSFIGVHVIAEADGAAFISLLEPAPDTAAAVQRCEQHRCFPVLAGPPGDTALLLISPIILYDHPEVAEQSEGALFDSTEIDEILTLRVMTMTDAEKAQARATDPHAARIIDQCDAMTPDSMARLHGVLRSPHGLIPDVPEGIDWWDPMADNAVAPDSDAVLVRGVRITNGSLVRLRPSRRADAQDLFFAGKLARVTSVHADVDGNAHVGVVLDDDPAADLHEWFGRYLYFAPDEVEPVGAGEHG